MSLSEKQRQQNIVFCDNMQKIVSSMLDSDINEPNIVHQLWEIEAKVKDLRVSYLRLIINGE